MNSTNSCSEVLFNFYIFASPQLFIVILNRIKIVCLVVHDGKSLVDCEAIWSSGLLV